MTAPIAVLRVPDVSHGQGVRLRDHPFEQVVVHLAVDDEPRAGRALLPLKSERRRDDAVGGVLDVGGLVDEDEVLAAHLQDRPLDPDLPRHDAARLFADLDADGARARERDEAGLRMLDERIADRRAAARQEVQDPVRHPRLVARLQEHRRDAGRVRGGLENDRVAGDERGGRHSRQDREREVPRGNHDGDAEGDVLELVSLAGKGRQGLWLGQPLHLAGVELAEVDRLGRVPVGLGPGLGLFEHHHRGELVLAAPEDRGDAEHERRALAGGHPAPRRESFRGGVDGAAGVREGALGEAADDLAEVARVDRLEVLGRRGALSPDPVPAPQGEAFLDLRQRCAEGVSVGFDGKIRQRLVAKFGQQDDLRKEEFIKARNVEWAR